GPAGALAGPNYTIDAAQGTTAGTNLFHSFSEFQIHTGESATFTGPNSITNVISRVTGPNATAIDGTLKSTIGNADFYFVNPNGVVFGNGAVIDVPAGFHVSTADRLNFSDGSYYSASNPGGSSFSTASVQSFGFLGGAIGAITMNSAT